MSPDQRERAIDRVTDGDDPVVASRPAEAALDAFMATPRGLAGTALIGGAMGAADLVPGFSGGTVALVTGIYPRLIANVRQGARALSLLLRGRIGEGGRAIAAIEWPFVATLLAGIGAVVVLFAATMQRLLERVPVQMSALFLGLVAGATVVAIRELRTPAAWQLGVAVPVAIVTFAVLGLRSGEIADPSLAALFGAGAIAVCAMILPGVSGSFLLLLLGMYTPVVALVADREVFPLAVLGVGAVVGLATASTALNWLLRRYHDAVLAALLGLMAGSARVLWPWPATEGIGDTRLGAPVREEIVVAAALTLGGIVAVVVFATLARLLTTATEHA